jgi:hypothetical protein
MSRVMPIKQFRLNRIVRNINDSYKHNCLLVNTIKSNSYERELQEKEFMRIRKEDQLLEKERQIEKIKQTLTEIKNILGV